MTTADDDFDKKTQAFVQWLKDRGVVISPKIAIHDYRAVHQGRGVIALEDIPVGESLFRIPRTAVLAVDTLGANSGATAETERVKALYAKAGEDLASLDPWMALIFHMMVRAPTKTDSDAEFGPYYDVLPREFSTLMFWDKKEVEELLQGSTVGERIGREEAEESYNEVLRPIFDKYRGDLEGIDTSVEAFHRMGSLIMSYSFDVDKREEAKEEEEESEKDDEDEENEEEEHELEEVEIEVDEDDEDEGSTVKAMVPLADILNAHTRLCNAHLFHESQGSVLEMRAIKPIPKGHQVYNTYGDLPNSDLLRRYGYVERGGSAYDVVELSTPQILAAAAKYFSGDQFEYAKKDQAACAKLTEKSLEKALDTLAKWQEEAGLIGANLGPKKKEPAEKSGEEDDDEEEEHEELGEIVDDSYDVPGSGAPPPELHILVNFLALWALDYAASQNPRLKLRSVFGSVLSTSKRAAADDTAADRSQRKKMRKAFLEALVARAAKSSGAGEAASSTVVPEAGALWVQILDARKSLYPASAADQKSESVDGAVDAGDDTTYSYSHKDMAAELIAGERRILDRLLTWVSGEQTGSSETGDKYITSLRKEWDTYEKDRKKKLKRSGGSDDIDKKKKKRR